MSDLIGEELGRYRILEQIGVGGMATVFKAFHPTMDRYVAVKVLPEHMGRERGFRKRFEREAKVIARLEHPHILPVYDYGEEGGRPYLVMRYIEAGTLKERLAAGPVDLTEIARILDQVGGALAHAHRLGVVHRDVKPTNVLLDAHGDCYLTDFGLAKMMEASVQLTATGVGLGTPAYMSPEQGQGEKVDSRSDIYCLGVVLYEMVTGQVPYQAETPMAVVLKHITAPLPLPREVQPRVHPAVERVILKALSKDPDDRFQTVEEMVAAFNAAVQSAESEEPGEVSVAVPPGEGFLARAAAAARQALPTGWRWALGGILLLLLLGLVLSRILLRLQLTGGGEEVVRVVEQTATVAVTAHATATTPPTPTSRPTAIPAAAVTVKWTYTAPDAIWYLDSWGDGLATGDLDDDGVPDVVFGTSGGYVVAVNGSDGRELWSYPITTQTDVGVNADMVDVDDDGILDVVGTGKGDASSQGRAIILALDRTGGLKWQAQGDFEEATDLTYGDMDGDGDTDVVAAVGTYPWSGGQVIALEGATGTTIWSQPLGSGYTQGLDARDVDGDGDIEIAVENYDNKLFLLDGKTGEILWSRPKEWYGRDVIIADVDDYGTYEIVAGGGIPVTYAPNGNQEWAGGTEGMNMSAADVNGDGHTEVIISSSFGGELHVLNGSTGEALWSRTRGGAHVLGDVDGDGVDDIVAGTIRYYGIEPPYSVDALDGSNNSLWHFPLDDIYNQSGFGLVATNLDGDPALEVLVANGTRLLALDAGAAMPHQASLADQARAIAESILNAITHPAPDRVDG